MATSVEGSWSVMKIIARHRNLFEFSVGHKLLRTRNSFGYVSELGIWVQKRLDWERILLGEDLTIEIETAKKDRKQMKETQWVQIENQW